jgi:hypothetical protein
VDELANVLAGSANPLGNLGGREPVIVGGYLDHPDAGVGVFDISDCGKDGGFWCVCLSVEVGDDTAVSFPGKRGIVATGLIKNV